MAKQLTQKQRNENYHAKMQEHAQQKRVEAWKTRNGIKGNFEQQSPELLQAVKLATNLITTPGIHPATILEIQDFLVRYNRGGQIKLTTIHNIYNHAHRIQRQKAKKARKATRKTRA